MPDLHCTNLHNNDGMINDRQINRNTREALMRLDKLIVPTFRDIIYDRLLFTYTC